LRIGVFLHPKKQYFLGGGKKNGWRSMNDKEIMDGRKGNDPPGGHPVLNRVSLFPFLFNYEISLLSINLVVMIIIFQGNNFIFLVN